MMEKTFSPNKFIFFFLLSLFFILISDAKSQEKGKELFEKNCAICHKLNTDKLVGPGLEDINKKRKKDWLIKFIRSSKDLIKSGDRDAVKIYEEFNKVDMPDMPKLSTQDIEEILTYIDSYVKEDISAVKNLKDTNYTETQIKRGQRLFMGLIKFENCKAVCSNCHIIKETDSLHWYPTAFDIAKISADKGHDFFEKTLKNPTSEVMKVTHQGYSFNDEEIYFLKAYLHHTHGTGLEKAKKFPVKFMIFLGLGLIMLIVLIDLIFLRKIKFRIIHLLILLVCIGFQIKIIAHEAIDLGRTKNYMPDQPIKFSHKIHAGQNQIDCKYCHSNVNNSKSAGIPTASLCMNCHSVVREGSITGKFEINKLYAALERNEPIQWVKVHSLPDHVFFSHAQHVNVGKVACEKCHGKVEEMHIVKQVSDLSMGFCVNCHRETNVQFNENKFYSSYIYLKDDIKSGRYKNISAEKVGSNDCMKCHY